MKRKIFKEILISMVLLAGLKAIWFCASKELHFMGGVFIFGTLFLMMGIWYYKK